CVAILDRSPVLSSGTRGRYVGYVRWILPRTLGRVGPRRRSNRVSRVAQRFPHHGGVRNHPGSSDLDDPTGPYAIVARYKRHRSERVVGDPPCTRYPAFSGSVLPHGPNNLWNGSLGTCFLRPLLRYEPCTG